METKTYYPLTAGQKILLLSQKYSSKKQINNVCARLNILNKLDEQSLYQAIYIATLRFPSINCRFTLQGKETVQYFSDSLPENIRLIDMSSASEEELQAEIDKWGKEPFPNNGMDVSLYRINIIKMPGDRISLYFCICHMIMDAYAITSFIKYTEQIYTALLNHNPIPDIKATPIECYQADQEYLSSDRHQKDHDFWYQHFQTEPTFTSINGKDSKEFDKGKKTGVYLRLYQISADHINLMIPADTVTQVQDLCLARRISPQCAYLLAIRSYLSAVCDTDDVTMMNTVARRATVIQKNAGGSMVNAIPFRSIISGSATFLEGMAQMYAIQREIYRHSDISCEEALSVFLNKFNGKSGIICHNYMATSVTFQPYFSSNGGTLDYTFRREKNGASTMPLYISIMPFDNSGDLWVNYEYIIGYIRPDSIQKLHAFMLKFLREGAAHPEMTIAELTRASI